MGKNVRHTYFAPVILHSENGPLYLFKNRNKQGNKSQMIFEQSKVYKEKSKGK